MSRGRAVQSSTAWQVTSIGVKTRDGPDRIAEAYRILLGQRRCRPVEPDTAVKRERSREKEQLDASRLVCPGVHGTPGA